MFFLCKIFFLSSFRQLVENKTFDIALEIVEEWDHEAWGPLPNQTECVGIAKLFCCLSNVEQLDNLPMTMLLSGQWRDMRDFFRTVQSTNGCLMTMVTKLVNDINTIRDLFRRHPIPFCPKYLSTLPIYNLLSHCGDN